MPNYCFYNMKVVGKEENVNKLIEYLSASYSYIRNEFQDTENTIWYKIERVGDNKGKCVIEKPFKVSLEYCSSDKHFFRIYEVHEDERNYNKNEVEVYLFGNCAWSSSVCMLSDNGTYYNDWNRREYLIGYETKCYADLCDDFRGTNMVDATKELDLDVEIYGEGDDFMEHYIIKKGLLVTEENCDHDMVLDDNGDPVEDDNGDIIYEGGYEIEFSI